MAGRAKFIAIKRTRLPARETQRQRTTTANRAGKRIAIRSSRMKLQIGLLRLMSWSLPDPRKMVYEQRD